VKNCLSPAQVLTQVNSGVAATTPGVLVTGLNTAMPVPSSLVAGSVDSALHRSAGMVTRNSLQIVGNNAEVTVTPFTVQGVVKINRLYGIFTNVTNVVKIQGCWFEATNGFTNAAITLDGVSCNGASLGSIVAKVFDATAAAYFGNNGSVQIHDQAGGMMDPFCGFIMCASTLGGGIIFRTDTDANTNATIQFVCEWVALSNGVGDGVA
jgi:hypothetical protein